MPSALGGACFLACSLTRGILAANTRVLLLLASSPPLQSTLAWAFASQAHFSKDLFDAIAGEAVKQAAEMQDVSVANLLWAVATLNGARRPPLAPPPPCGPALHGGPRCLHAPLP